MSNNRSNNRRRGRGNNRSQGGNQLNRIDSRARGNAPQLLEKYKKLAHDASLNGDRVQAEYYLQFADHYFRVIADGKTQKDDVRGRREAQDDDDEFEDEGDRSPRRGRREANEDQSDSGDSEGGDADEFAPAENPFVRESRSKPRRRTSSKPRARDSEGDADEGESGQEQEAGGLDPSALPPAISRDEDSEPAPAPRRTRKPRSRGKDDDEKLEAVS